MRITMIGHSTVLVETVIEGEMVRSLTDPYFGTRGNPAYHRTSPPAPARDAMGNVNVVLLSHHHWDHVDRPYLRRLPRTTKVLAPWPAAWITRLLYTRHAQGLRWWHEMLLDGLTITAVPAHHPALGCGYVVESDEATVYFAGDTYLGRFMTKIGQEFEIDVALIPVTTFRIPLTLGERQAVEAIRRLKPQIVIPIHLDIEPRSPLMQTDHSVRGFEVRLRAEGLAAQVVRLANGESFSL